jgi:hypothetical protein
LLRRKAIPDDQYSKKIEDQSEKISDDLSWLDDLHLTPIVEETNEEVIEALGGLLKQHDVPPYAVAPDPVTPVADNDDIAPEAEWSNKVTAPPAWSNKVIDVPTKSRSNKVTRRFRRLDKNDIQTLGNIPTTSKPVSPEFDAPLVDDWSDPLPLLIDPWFNPLPSHLHAVNDNVQLPVWEHSSDRLKLTFANRGLVSLGQSPEGCWSDVAAFSLNLTPERIAEAQRHPKGFIDSLKRDLDRVFNRMIGEVPSYWFGAGATQDGRLHLHGAIHTKKSSAPAVKVALLAIGGKWPDDDKEAENHQLDLQPMTDADGWVRYVLKQGPAARRLIITGKSLTIPKELRREGHRLYDAMQSA